MVSTMVLYVQFSIRHSVPSGKWFYLNRIKSWIFFLFVRSFIQKFCHAFLLEFLVSCILIVQGFSAGSRPEEHSELLQVLIVGIPLDFLLYSIPPRAPCVFFFFLGFLETICFGISQEELSGISAGISVFFLKLFLCIEFSHFGILSDSASDFFL